MYHGLKFAPSGKCIEIPRPAEDPFNEGTPPPMRAASCTVHLPGGNPLTDDTTCYFFAYGPRAKEGALADAFYELGMTAFSEDRVMVEAQQRNIDLFPRRQDAIDLV